MKTTTVARGFLGAVASLLGVVAVGCSADVMDEGAAGEGEIGSVAQAVVAADVVNQSVAFNNSGQDRAKYGASCTITDISNPNSPVEYALFAGGFDGNDETADFSNDAVLFDGTAYSNPITFTGERAFAKMVQVPGAPNKCLLVGGQNAGGKVGQIVLFTLTKPLGVLTLAASDAGVLSTARSHLEAQPCASGKVLIMGGYSSGTSTVSNVMDVWNNQTGTTAIPTLKNTNASPATVTLALGRAEFASAVSDNDSTHIAIAGGDTNAGLTATIEALDLDGSCNLASSSATAPANVTSLTAGASVVQLGGSTTAVPRSQLVGVYDSFNIGSDGRERFVFALGNDTNPSKLVDIVGIDWTTLTNSAMVSSSSPAAAQEAARPTLVKMASGRFVVIGGEGTGDNFVQEYDRTQGTPWTSTSTDSGSANLVVREGAFGALVAGSVYYSAGKDPGGPTFHTTTFEVH